ncbi:hypothetical protein GCM10008910_13330 [Faecalicatena orotica]|uniref:Uncharacterized protein n=1 Tax=Faecalicatena orotica TaxID=1544 RepID=A0A2Y9BG77_9FIRM|nr:hypothetical protein [Faecalicatena orotica]PWJ31377.1 hypothetical protein A8806_102233 [Faecalicatena orotica]SSA54583.1 hypothetical protein SAMN05216536_102233 [Faecalicatena orotica]
MQQNIIEYLREQSIRQLFATKGFKKAWRTWAAEIKGLAPLKTAYQLFNLGDSLRDIFYTTNTSKARSQSDVSGGGANWEALVCWYLNLCLIGRRTVVIKHNVKLMPPCINDAITVNYGNFPSNTESDLIAITFPDKLDYFCDKDSISIKDTNGDDIHKYKTNRSKYNILEILDALCIRDFNDIEIHIIQCKTNWNDNAQIPMLWDAVYAATNFRSGVSVGLNGYSITDVKRFTYSFVTVPTVKLEKIKKTSLCVFRVMYLSGGNYWGLPSEAGIANSVKEMLNRNLKTGSNDSHITTIKAFIPELGSTYNYFQLM